MNLDLDLETLKHFKTIFVGYSGGLDSTVLLHRLANSDLVNKLEVIHINHQLSPNAKAWVQQYQSAKLARTPSSARALLQRVQKSAKLARAFSSAKALVRRMFKTAKRARALSSARA